MIEEGLTGALKSAWPDIAVFPSHVPEGQKPPFATYREIDRNDGKSVVFEIDACAIPGLSVDGYRQSKQLSEAIRLALAEGFSYADGCASAARLIKRADHVDQVEPMHWTRAQYLITINTDPY